jgi:hypothetical protein
MLVIDDDDAMHAVHPGSAKSVGNGGTDYALGIRFGSIATVLRYPRHVRYWPDSDQLAVELGRRLQPFLRLPDGALRMLEQPQANPVAGLQNELTARLTGNLQLTLFPPRLPKAKKRSQL